LSENIIVERLKTTPRQAARSQEMVSKVKDSVGFVSWEPKYMDLGRVKNNFFTPQSESISDDIINDFAKTDFDNGQIKYGKDYLIMVSPNDGIVWIYDTKNGYWMPPMNWGFSRVSVVDGEWYGHSSSKPETYKLFTGYNYNGNAIFARAYMSYINNDAPADLKNFNEYYVEGYIQANTKMTAGITLDIDGCATNMEGVVDGTDAAIVCLGGDDMSLGKKSIGKYSLARLDDNNFDTLPPKFRVIFTPSRDDYYEYQPYFESNEVDYRWEILRFGPKVEIASHKSVSNKKPMGK
jgi:hypothetical protein